MHWMAIRDRESHAQWADSVWKDVEQITKFPDSGHMGAYPEKIVHLETLAAALPSESRILEIGFNMGHSAHTLLYHAHERIKCFDSFDLSNHLYTQAIWDLFTEEYWPSGFRTHAGNSRKTLPAWTDKIEAGFEDLYNLVIVDGDHTKEGTLSDLNCALRLTRDGGQIWIDDTHGSGTYAAYQQWVQGLATDDAKAAGTWVTVDANVKCKGRHQSQYVIVTVHKKSS